MHGWRHDRTNEIYRHSHTQGVVECELKWQFGDILWRHFAMFPLQPHFSPTQPTSHPFPFHSQTVSESMSLLIVTSWHSWRSYIYHPVTPSTDHSPRTFPPTTIICITRHSPAILHVHRAFLSLPKSPWALSSVYLWPCSGVNILMNEYLNRFVIQLSTNEEKRVERWPEHVWRWRAQKKSSSDLRRSLHPPSRGRTSHFRFKIRKKMRRLKFCALWFVDFSWKFLLWIL